MATSGKPLPLHRHPEPHREVARRYRRYFGEQAARTSTVFSILAFAVSLFVNFQTSEYTRTVASNFVTDIVLSNTPVFDVDGFFVYGAVALVVFIALLCFTHPKRLPFTLYSLALFFFIRAGFMTLTHIGPYPIHTPIEFSSSFGIALSKIFFGDDLFFSGHTGAPFLMALLYWREPILRYVFLAWSVFLAAIVLLGHIHYSIDVASAYFITFAIYHIALWLFPADHARFLDDEEACPVYVAD